MSPAQQAQAPTVGDTLTVVHRVPLPAGALLEPRGPTDSAIATLVGAPIVQREGDSVRIAYTLAVWAPGRHQLVIPGAVVVGGDGRIDTLPDATVALRVASVLPERVAPESIAPQAARPWVERGTVSWWPFVVLLVPVALLLGAAAFWWRRRGPVVAASPRPAASRAERVAQVERWLDAGEVALAVDHLAAMLPDDEAGRAWHERARALRFDPDRAAELAAAARAGLQLLSRGEQ